MRRVAFKAHDLLAPSFGLACEQAEAWLDDPVGAERYAHPAVRRYIGRRTSQQQLRRLLEEAPAQERRRYEELAATEDHIMLLAEDRFRRARDVQREGQAFATAARAEHDAVEAAIHEALNGGEEDDRWRSRLLGSTGRRARREVVEAWAKMRRVHVELPPVPAEPPWGVHTAEEPEPQDDERDRPRAARAEDIF